MPGRDAAVTAPIWAASPPEVHSALLSAGPGAGPLFATAQAWHSLSTEYASIAEELGAVVASVRSGPWQGPSAQTYAAAHEPYLAWLTQASADSTATAAQHETAAGAYAAALAAMPTLAELAANHLTHGILAATNFFGINTIPIAVNEADYARMWTQAAATMAAYQATSSAAVSSTPSSTNAPQIEKASAQSVSGDSSNNAVGLLQQIYQFLQEVAAIPDHLLTQFENELNSIIKPMLASLGENWDPVAGTINGVDYLDITLNLHISPIQPLWWTVRALWLYQFYSVVLHGLLENPIAFLSQSASTPPLDAVLLMALHPILVAEVGISASMPVLPTLSAASAAVAAVAAQGALVPAVPAALPDLAAPALAASIPAHTGGPTLIASAGGSSPTAATAAAPATPGGGSSTAPPPPPPQAAGFLYAVAGIAGGPGGPGAGFNSGTGAGARASSPAFAAASVAAPTAATARLRRRQRARQREYGDAFMDVNAEPDWEVPPDTEPAASTVASDRGGGPLGFSGTVSQNDARAAGLATLEDDGFGGGPATPLVPKTWNPDALD